MWNTITQIVTKAFKSKALILGWLNVAAGVVGLLAGHEFIQQYPEAVAVFVAVSGVLQTVIRAVTFIPLSEKTSIKV